MDHDISSLMIGMLQAPGKDNYGKEKDMKRPLFFDTVMEGRERASDSLLLSLPAEIMSAIVERIADDKRTLAALALVNSDCRQLARSCQFVDVGLDYSPSAHELVQALVDEARTTRKRTSFRPTIGACIRRITMRSHPAWIGTKHYELHESIFGGNHEAYSKDERDDLRKAATNEYLNNYRSKVLIAISDAMPHLEEIAWHDQIFVDEFFLKVITHSPIQHLKLSRIPIERPYRMEPPLTPAVIPLRSLRIDVRLSLRLNSNGEDPSELVEPSSISPFFETLLHRCAPTLENLVWHHMAFTKRRTISLGGQSISFPHLRRLILRWIELDPASLASLLQAPLRELTLPKIPDCNAIAKTISSCELLRDLQTLVIPRLDSPKAAAAHIDFLEKHSHIEKLCVEQSDPDVLDSKILPLLSGGEFSCLRSLSLSWRGPDMEDPMQPHIADIPEESLAAIGKITSLEQLCLSAGEEIGWRCQWAVDHEIMRKHLRNLTMLKKLAISRDTYPMYALPYTEAYYSMRIVRGPEHLDALARPELDSDFGESDDSDDSAISRLDDLSYFAGSGYGGFISEGSDGFDNEDNQTEEDDDTDTHDEEFQWQLHDGSQAVSDSRATAEHDAGTRGDQEGEGTWAASEDDSHVAPEAVATQAMHGVYSTGPDRIQEADDNRLDWVEPPTEENQEDSSADDRSEAAHVSGWRSVEDEDEDEEEQILEQNEEGDEDNNDDDDDDYNSLSASEWEEQTEEDSDLYDDDPDDELGSVWERAHRNRMLTQAEKYAAVLPSLEWIYCGQWAMVIKENQITHDKLAVPLTEGRDTCRTLLNRMFSMGYEDL